MKARLIIHVLSMADFDTEEECLPQRPLSELGESACVVNIRTFTTQMGFVITAVTAPGRVLECEKKNKKPANLLLQNRSSIRLQTVDD